MHGEKEEEVRKKKGQQGKGGVGKGECRGKRRW